MSLLCIRTVNDLSKITEEIGEQVEVMYDNLKGELSIRGYHDSGPGSTPGYRRMRNDIGRVNTIRMDAEASLGRGGNF